MTNCYLYLFFWIDYKRWENFQYFCIKLMCMTISAIKKNLHQYIDRADESKLKAIYLLLENDVCSLNYSKEELEKFYDILHKYENGTIKAFPVDVTHSEIRAQVSGK